jgi:hypothetical protein
MQKMQAGPKGEGPVSSPGLRYKATLRPTYV